MPAPSSNKAPLASGAKHTGSRDWKAPTWMQGQKQEESATLLGGGAGRRDPLYKDDYDEDADAIADSDVAAGGPSSGPAEDKQVNKS